MAFNVGFTEFFYTNSGSRTTNWPTSGTTVNWEVPDGVYWVWVKAQAGGGGGGSSVTNATDGGGGGGGSGEYVEGIQIPTTPGDTIPIYVGGGGPRGVKSVTSYNVHAGPEGNSSAGSSGFGGEDTSVGPVKVKGGYGGNSGSVGHSGMGGGVGAGPKGGNSGASGTTCADRLSGSGTAGYSSTNKYEAKYWGGSGGGSGSFATIGFTPPAGGNGGRLGPFEGAAGGSVDTSLAGGGAGGGGGSSIFGPGGTGGKTNGNAGAVPAGSYGAGGGGGGGNDTVSSPAADAFVGTAGADGYVSLHYFIVTPAEYVLSTQTGSFTLTGNAVTFTYP